MTPATDNIARKLNRRRLAVGERSVIEMRSYECPLQFSRPAIGIITVELSTIFVISLVVLRDLVGQIIQIGFAVRFVARDFVVV